MSPIAQAFISPEEIYPDRVVSYEEVAYLARQLNRNEALKFLGFVNLIVSSAATQTHLTNNTDPLRDVQTALLREILGAQLLGDLKAKFADASLLDRPILHRTQILFAIRLVATHSDPQGGNMLAVRDDFDSIGELLFLINGLFRQPAPPSTGREALWIATDVGPLHELENPPIIELSWPRVTDLLTQRLPAVAHDRGELERLEQITVFTTGFNLQSWIDLSWMLFAFWGTLKHADLMKDIGRGFLSLDAPHSVISKDLLRRAVEGIGIPFDKLPEHLKIESFLRAVLFDLTPFRTYPLWIMPDGRAMCVDATLLMERLGPHMFWRVMNALDSPERRRQFNSTWGLAFESYALDALGGIFRSKKWTYYRNPIDPSTNEEFSDALALRDEVALVVECKGTFLRSADKYSGNLGDFFRGLTQKFGRGRHGGVRQLVRAVRRIWFESGAASIIPAAKLTKEVFPILIVQDPILRCGPVARILSDRFDVALNRARRHHTQQAPKIWPLTVMTADDLDRLSASVEATGQRIDALLKRFHRHHPSRMIPLGEFLSSKVDDGLRIP
jgi:hypothetical protein